MKRLVGMMMVLAATVQAETPPAEPAATRAADIAAVVATEQEYVTELTALKRLDLAEQHLAVIRKLAPERRALIRTLEGDLHVAREQWLEALDRFGGIPRDSVDDAAWLHIQHGRLLACTALSRHAAAYTILDELPTGEARPDWAVETDYSLGMTLLKRAASDPDAIARGERDQAVTLLTRYAETLEEAERPGWVQIQEAGVYHDRLLEAAAELSNADTALDIPDPLRPFALRIRGLYRRIIIRHPGSPAAALAGERIGMLDRMMRDDVPATDSDEDDAQ